MFHMEIPQSEQIALLLPVVSRAPPWCQHNYVMCYTRGRLIRILLSIEQDAAASRSRHALLPQTLPLRHKQGGRF